MNGTLTLAEDDNFYFDPEAAERPVRGSMDTTT